MPKKKNAALSHLPPLVFVNSPVLQPAPVLTPDLAVDNPVTAKVVPIENLIDNSWVSPQFWTLDGYRYQQNCQSMRQASLYTQQRRSKINPDIFLQKCTFQPLQFMTSNNNEQIIQTRPVSGLQMCSASLEVGACCNTDHQNVEESQSTFLGIMSNITVQTPALYGLGDSSPCLPDDNSGFSHLSLNDSNSNKMEESTPTRTFHRDTVQQELLKPRNLFCQSDSRKAQQSTNVKDCSDNMQVVKGFICSNLHTRTVLNPDNVFDYAHEKADHGSGDSTQISAFFSRGNRSESCPLTKMKSAILVVDTPECDYGLTFRQRQLRCRPALKNRYG